MARAVQHCGQDRNGEGIYEYPLPKRYIFLRVHKCLDVPFGFAIFFLFLAVHYVENSGFAFIKRNWWERQDIKEFALRGSHIKNKFLAFLLFPIKMADYARIGVSRHRTPYKSLSLYFSLIGNENLISFCLSQKCCPNTTFASSKNH